MITLYSSQKQCRNWINIFMHGLLFLFGYGFLFYMSQTLKVFNLQKNKVKPPTHPTFKWVKNLWRLSFSVSFIKCWCDTKLLRVQKKFIHHFHLCPTYVSYIWELGFLFSLVVDNCFMKDIKFDFRQIWVLSTLKTWVDFYEFEKKKCIFVTSNYHLRWLWWRWYWWGWRWLRLRRCTDDDTMRYDWWY